MCLAAGNTCRSFVQFLLLLRTRVSDRMHHGSCRCYNSCFGVEFGSEAQRLGGGFGCGQS